MLPARAAMGTTPHDVDHLTQELGALRRQVADLEARLAAASAHESDALRDASQRLDSLLENSPLAVIEWATSDYRIVRWSDEATRVFGWTPEEAIGRRLEDLNIVYPDDVPAVRAVMADMFHGERGRNVTRNRNLRKDGSVIHCEWYNSTIRGEPDRFSLLSLVLDVTQRKRTEEALRRSEAMLERTARQAKVGGWELDVATGSMSWSQETFRMHEVDPSVVPTVALAQSFYTAEFQTVINGMVQRALRDGTPWDYEMPATTATGRSIWVHGSGSAELENGRVVKLWGTIQDISERRQAVEARKLLEAEVNRAQNQKIEAVGRLAGGVAHDFNNMLGVILGSVELVMEQLGPSAPEYTDLLEIKGAARRSTELTRQLLAFARKQPVVPKVIDLNEAIESMLEMLQRLIGENIELVFRPDAGPSLAKIDSGQVDQTLVNLCINARDAIGGVGRITVETARATFDRAFCARHPGASVGEYVMLAVSDTGSGIDQEALAHLFEPFYTTKGVGQGTGLGLATVYGIVKQNQGFVDVTSQPGHGSTFRIYLPRQTEPAATGADASQARPVRGHETILFVEDEPSLARIGKRVLEGLGYRVLTATTPSEAVRLVEQGPGPIHLLASDVIMPGMSGPQLAAKLQSRLPDLKCLYLSGYAANAIAEHGVMDESVNFLPKPYSTADLAAKVRAVLDGKVTG